MMKDVEQAQFLEQWAPKNSINLKPTEENLRWNIARARAAEAKIKEYEEFFRTLRKLMGDRYV